MKTQIYVTTSFEGFHCWPQAPQEVFFLRQLHRHNFGVKVTLRVTHSRAVEFILFKRKLDAVIKDELSPYIFSRENETSCEDMAMFVFNYFNTLPSYEGAVASVEVNEDNENGAIVSQEV